MIMAVLLDGPGNPVCTDRHGRLQVHPTLFLTYVVLIFD